MLLPASFVACNKIEDEDPKEVKFEIKPAGTIHYMTIIMEFAFHCIDQSEPPCYTAMFTTPGDDGQNWFGYPQDHSDCIQFIGVITYENVEYTLFGDIQRAFGEGSGPFVSGNYTSYNFSDETSLSGTFYFYEQDLVEGTSPCE
jgi:hypothetical protein